MRDCIPGLWRSEATNRGRHDRRARQADRSEGGASGQGNPRQAHREGETIRHSRGTRKRTVVGPSRGSGSPASPQGRHVTGPLTIPSSDPAALSDRLTAIARAQMLLQMETGDSPPEETSVRDGSAIDFAVTLLREAGGTREFKPAPLSSGTGPVLQVGDRVQLRFLNRGVLDVDITVLQVDQNYDILPMFPYGSGGVLNRLYSPEKIERAD